MKSLRKITTVWRPLSASALVISMGSAALLAPSVSAQEALPPILDAAPANTAMFQQVDLNLAGDQWQQTDALLARLGHPDALDTWRAEMVEDHGDEGGFTEADLDAVTGGEVAFVVSDQAVATLIQVLTKPHKWTFT